MAHLSPCAIRRIRASSVVGSRAETGSAALSVNVKPRCMGISLFQRDAVRLLLIEPDLERTRLLTVCLTRGQWFRPERIVSCCGPGRCLRRQNATFGQRQAAPAMGQPASTLPGKGSPLRPAGVIMIAIASRYRREFRLPLLARGPRVSPWQRRHSIQTIQIESTMTHGRYASEPR